MVKSKIMSRIFSFLAISFIIGMFLPCQKVGAIYKESENKVVSDQIEIDKSKDKISFSIQYQYGVYGMAAYVCTTTTATMNCINSAITKFEDQTNKDQDNPIMNYSSSQEVQVLKLEYTHTEGTPLYAYRDNVTSTGDIENLYKVVVTAKFCKMRKSDNTACQNWESGNNPRVILEKEVNITSAGITESGEINDTLANVLNIVNNIFIPVLWLGLGILLIVRGIMLGIGIVKSADEPEVRKKKVSGIIWLFIGVAVGYVVTIGAHAVMGMLGYGGYFK